MPVEATNGSSRPTLEMNDGETFLFTSESVGEGHPGNCIFYLVNLQRDEKR